MRGYNRLSAVLYWLLLWSQRAVHFRRIRLPEVAVPLIGFVLRLRYGVCRIRSWLRLRRGKLRVLFVIGDKTKWKAGLLYKEMLKSGYVDPFVCPTVMDVGFYGEKELHTRFKECKEYFANRGYQTKCLNKEDDLTPIPLSSLHPDILIYLQPWGLSNVHQPIAASECALTYYLPYCTFSYGNRLEMYDLPFVRFVYCHMMDNDRWVAYYRKLSSPFRFGCIMKGVGSPYCEQILNRGDVKTSKKCIIYAPHWSFKHEKNKSMYYISTFDWSGIPMLEFAKAHPEINWIFKPHPGLRAKLESTGFMANEEIDRYYKTWEQLGESNYDSDYDELFARSTAMVTDCSTFLVEYLVTGKPLIRLTSKSSAKPMPPNEMLLDAFYVANDVNSMLRQLEKIAINGSDTMWGLRQRVRHIMGLDDIHSVDAIMSCLLGRKERTLKRKAR